MKTAARAVILLIAFAAPPPARPDAAQDAELSRLTESWNKAWNEKDVATIERLMGPSYAYVTPGGQLVDRAAVLGIARSPGYRPASGSRTELRVTSLGPDTAAVLHRFQGSGSYEGKPYANDHRCTIVWARPQGAWNVAWEQCTPNTPPGGADASPAVAAVRKVEARRVEATLKSDVATLDRILSPDLTYMHSSGAFDTKESLLASLSSGTLKYLAFEERDLAVRVYGDSSVVTGRATVRAQRPGSDPVNLDLALTAVYALDPDGAWRLVAWQTTRLPQ